MYEDSVMSLIDQAQEAMSDIARDMALHAEEEDQESAEKLAEATSRRIRYVMFTLGLAQRLTTILEQHGDDVNPLIGNGFFLDD